MQIPIWALLANNIILLAVCRDRPIWALLANSACFYINDFTGHHGHNWVSTHLHILFVIIVLLPHFWLEIVKMIFFGLENLQPARYNIIAINVAWHKQGKHNFGPIPEEIKECLGNKNYQGCLEQVSLTVTTWPWRALMQFHHKASYMYS